jgi:predicted amidohydrolase YtcJ
MNLLLRNVELAHERADVRVVEGAVAAIAPSLLREQGDEVVDGEGGALLHGLHDQHLHVHALAAARASVAVDPGATPDASAFAATLRAAAARGPVRAVGYHERVAGALDRDVLDRVVANEAVRVQHRTGVLWVLNSVALDAIGADRAADPRVERASSGRATGRIWRGDDLVRGATALPAVGAIGAELAAFGVTAITDASATNDATTAAALATLPQRVRVMGPLDLELPASVDAVLGEVKVLLDDDALPSLDDTVALVRAAHARGRGVAFHCVTLVQVRFAIEALRSGGAAHDRPARSARDRPARSARDRVEHASVAPPDVVADLAALGVTVVTHPSFIRARGDDYLVSVDPRDVDALYPVASLLAAGIPTFGSSDAPYGPLDPWAAMRAASERRTASGRVLGEGERLVAPDALGLFTPNRPVAVGGPADLVLLAAPRRRVLDRLSADDVVLTIVRGAIVHDAR